MLAPASNVGLAIALLVPEIAPLVSLVSFRTKVSTGCAVKGPVGVVVDRAHSNVSPAFAVTVPVPM